MKPGLFSSALFGMLFLAVLLFVCHAAEMFSLARAGQPALASVEAPANAFDFRDVITRAKDQVFPAVIFIKCITETHESGKKMSVEVSGSGVIISSDGQALTNWHVVDKALEVRCLLYDGRAFHAEIVGTDKDTDLALLQLGMAEIDDPLPVAKLGDSSVLVEGDFVMAMGAPWGMSRSVSIGIISCTRRYLPGNSEYSLWLQTDAAISPGNSGGPLVNTSGEVIGLNTRGVIYGGDMGFAVPTQTIQRVIRRIREVGAVEWSYTGIQLQALRDFSRNMYFDATEGVIVAGTDPDSPARRAGILPQDRLVSIGEEQVTAITEEDLPAIRRTLGLLAVDKPAALGLVRGGEVMKLKITPREKGEIEGEELDLPRWDFTAKSINQFDNPDLYFHRKEGVFVFGVEYPGNAVSAGLNEQDIILKVGKKKIKTLEELRTAYDQAVKNIEKEHKILIAVTRQGLMRQIVLDFARDYERQ